MDGSTAAKASEMDRSKAESKPRFKSYRKKYYKVRSQFGKTLSENNGAWEAEQNMQRVVRRLEEELDQLRELLIDVNGSEACPKHLTVSLSSTDAVEDAWLRRAGVLPPLSDLDRKLQEKGEDYQQAETFRTMHQELEQELKRGESTLTDYKTAFKAALPALKMTKALAYLEDTIPHTKLSDVPRHSIPPEITEDSPIGYLHPDREAEYLERLDAEISERWANLGKLSPEQRQTQLSTHANHAARDNPTSALNWLRKHQPEVFVDGNDAPGRAQESGKASSHAAAHAAHSAGRRESGRGKRGSHTTQEMMDEDGAVVGVEPMSRSRGGKRKRPINDDDDVSYHPSKGTVAPKKRVRKSAMEMAAERD